MSSLFILGNSLSGLAGLLVARPEALALAVSPQGMAAMAAVVLAAGALGSRMGSRHWPVAWIRRTLAVVLVVAAIKLLAPGR
ncbi:MAG: hypothetical protein ACKOZW_06385 [Cyanobium sp.]